MTAFPILLAWNRRQEQPQELVQGNNTPRRGSGTFNSLCLFLWEEFSFTTSQDPSLQALCAASQQADEPQRNSEGLGNETEHRSPERAPAEQPSHVRHSVGGVCSSQLPPLQCCRVLGLQTRFSDFSYMITKSNPCWAVCLACGILYSSPWRHPLAGSP